MDIKDIYNVRKTSIQMLEDRGYNLSKVARVDINEFMIMYEEDNYDLVDDDNKIVVSFFKGTKTFSKKDLENTVKLLKDKYGEGTKMILVLKEKHNVIITKELTSEQYINVELFIFKDLIYNKVRHVGVPEHIKLNEEEIKELLNKYKLNKRQLPRMQITDPVARYYGAKGGDIFKIIRKSESSGFYTTYRLVN